MSLCAIIGDGIALGLALAMPQCDYNVRTGRTAADIATIQLRQHYRYVVISAGTNKPNDARIRSNLYKIRQKITARKVIWVAPINQKANYAVRIVATVFGDPVVTFRTTDGRTPYSYKELARAVDKVN